MTLTVTAEQRDALYDQILDRLSGIGDIEMVVQAENFDVAERPSSSDLPVYCDLCWSFPFEKLSSHKPYRQTFTGSGERS